MEPNNPYNTPAQDASGMSQPVGLRSVCLKRIDVMSAASMMGVLYAFIGLIIGGFMSLLALLGVAAGGGDAAIGGVITGIGALIIVPIMYGVLGFLGGIIGALLYNFVAGFVGGVRVEVEG